MSFDVAAGAVAQLGQRFAYGMDPDPGRRKEQLFLKLHQIPLAPPQLALTAGAGALQIPDLMAVKTGYMWSIRRFVGSLFSAGTVTIYKNGVVSGGVAVGGEPLFTFPSAGTYTFGRGEMLLDQGDCLVISATGITGSVQINGVADCFERWLLPEYLG